jgi:hypothetical protein
MVGDHPDRDQVFILAGQKSNLSKPPESLAYRIRSAGADNDTATIEYLGVSEVTAQQMSATPQDEGERDRLSEARDFLKDTLRAGPVPTKQIKAYASEADISWRTIERAKASLKIQAFKDSQTLKWMWTLPGPPEDGDEDREKGHVADVQSSVGGDGGDGGLPLDTKTANHGGDGGLPPSTTTTTKDKGYIREDRQDRQDRQPPPNELHADTPTEDRQDRQATEDRQDSVTIPVSFGLEPGESATVAKLSDRREHEMHPLDCECDECQWGEV